MFVEEYGDDEDYDFSLEDDDSVSVEFLEPDNDEDQYEEDLLDEEEAEELEEIAEGKFESFDDLFESRPDLKKALQETKIIDLSEAPPPTEDEMEKEVEELMFETTSEGELKKAIIALLEEEKQYISDAIDSIPYLTPIQHMIRRVVEMFPTTGFLLIYNDGMIDLMDSGMITVDQDMRPKIHPDYEKHKIIYLVDADGKHISPHPILVGAKPKSSFKRELKTLVKFIMAYTELGELDPTIIITPVQSFVDMYWVSGEFVPIYAHLALDDQVEDLIRVLAADSAFVSYVEYLDYLEIPQEEFERAKAYADAGILDISEDKQEEYRQSIKSAVATRPDTIINLEAGRLIIDSNTEIFDAIIQDYVKAMGSQAGVLTSGAMKKLRASLVDSKERIMNEVLIPYTVTFFQERVGDEGTINELLSKPDVKNIILNVASFMVYGELGRGIWGGYKTLPKEDLVGYTFTMSNVVPDQAIVPLIHCLLQSTIPEYINAKKFGIEADYLVAASMRDVREACIQIGANHGFTIQESISFCRRIETPMKTGELTIIENLAHSLAEGNISIYDVYNSLEQVLISMYNAYEEEEMRRRKGRTVSKRHKRETKLKRVDMTKDTPVRVPHKISQEDIREAVRLRTELAKVGFSDKENEDIERGRLAGKLSEQELRELIETKITVIDELKSSIDTRAYFNHELIELEFPPEDYRKLLVAAGIDTEYVVCAHLDYVVEAVASDISSYSKQLIKPIVIEGDTWYAYPVDPHDLLTVKKSISKFGGNLFRLK